MKLSCTFHMLLLLLLMVDVDEVLSMALAILCNLARCDRHV